jgi:hypothetical protein
MVGLLSLLACNLQGISTSRPACQFASRIKLRLMAIKFA